MNWRRRRGWERRMDAELRFHLESRRQDYIGQGLSPEEAARRAGLDFGALELAKDECRDEKPAAWFDHMLRDLRYACRSLRGSPGFAAAAIATLGLGIGANTAIFQLFDAVRVRALPVPDPQSLVTVQLADHTGWRGSQASPYAALTNPQWERLRDTQQAFSGVLAWSDNDFGLGAGDSAHLARGLFVSGSFFHVLGVHPLMGRVLAPADDRRGCGLPGAVISYAFWQGELGGDPSVIGRKLTLNYQPVDVIGVTPAGFTGLEVGRSYDVAVPICSQAVLWSEGNWLDEGTVWWLNVMGRLKPGESLAQANAQLRVDSPALFQVTLPANYPAINVKDYLKFKLAAVPAGTGVSELREQYGQPLILLLVTSAFVLLVACANLANLILAHATSREHEFAVRMAIGASRGRLIRQLMVENLLLAAAGAAGGVGLSGILTRVLISMLQTQGDPLYLDLHPDLRLLAFAAGLATLTCVLFGLTPALRATRVTLSDALKSAGRSLSAGRERFELRQALVVSQVALSLVLLVGALLFAGSLRKLLAVDAGFQRNGVLVSEVDFRRLKIPVTRRVDFKRDLLQKIRTLPGITSAAEVAFLPLSGASTTNAVWREGAGPDQKFDAKFDAFGEGYLKTMGMRLLAGRDFTERDNLSAPGVAIVNQTFARRLGLGRNPVGAKFTREATPSSPERVFEIVGLVGDTKYYNLREKSLPIAFVSIDQSTDPDPSARIVVRSSVSLAETASALRHVLKQVSPLVSADFQSFEDEVREGLLRERLMATLSGFFGALAALISAVGLYGVMSYLVARRTNEIGVRIALGAGRGRIVALVLRQAAALLAAGVVAGTIVTLALAGVAKSLLFGLKPYDAATLTMAVVLLTAVMIAASYLPARRAARIEPLAAIRDE
ncbi:MAG TPA: ABC transporter permease [Bryobacteraceae bacterium]|nr:ABC transporter permease [Bryobacteraceae bacterium]